MTFKELSSLDTTENKDSKEKKTPNYTRKAVAKYQAKFDRVNLNLPRGLKDQCKRITGESLNGLVVRLLMEVCEENGTPFQPAEDATE